MFRLARAGFVLALPLFIVLTSGGPAFAGLIFDWVSINVFDERGEIDPAVVTGRIELSDDIGFGDVVKPGDIQSLDFDDGMFDFWDETFISDGTTIASELGLSIQTTGKKKKKLPAKLKDPSLSLSALVDDEGNPIDGKAPKKDGKAPKKKVGGLDKVGLFFGTPVKAKKAKKKITKVDPFPDPMVPDDVEIWSWFTRVDSRTAMSGEGYWRLQPSSVPVPEPAALVLVATGLLGLNAVWRRRRR